MALNKCSSRIWLLVVNQTVTRSLYWLSCALRSLLRNQVPQPHTPLNLSTLTVDTTLFSGWLPACGNLPPCLCHFSPSYWVSAKKKKKWSKEKLPPLPKPYTPTSKGASTDLTKGKHTTLSTVLWKMFLCRHMLLWVAKIILQTFWRWHCVCWKEKAAMQTPQCLFDHLCLRRGTYFLQMRWTFKKNQPAFFRYSKN